MSHIRRVMDAYSLDRHSARMRVFLARTKPSKYNSKKILVEAGQPKSNQLALSLFLPVLQETFQAGSIFYESGLLNFSNQLKAKFRHTFSPIKQLSSSGLMCIQKSHVDSTEAKIIADQILQTTLTPELLEQLKYRDIIIGDLVYDTYLRRSSLATIDLRSNEFREVLIEAIINTNYWIEYFSNEDIAAVCVSHCVYLGAIPARVGISLGVQVFQVNTHAIYRVTSEFPHAYTDFVNYKRDFMKLPLSIREAGIEKAIERLSLRFSGEVAVDMPYSTKSAYSQSLVPMDSEIIQSGRLKVLVAVHDFFDSPHSFGNNFYPDFYIWLTRLNELSYEVDYDWYIKTHPDIKGPGITILEQFIVQSNGFRLLPSDTSHHEIIRAGIDCVLTVYGTIAMEYPALGIPAVNASLNNPHKAFNFSLTPKNRKDYESTILNLGSYCSIPINQEEILEYYFMHHIYNLKSWIFKDEAILLKDIGGYDASNSSKIYSYFLDHKNRWANEEYRSAIIAFLNSNDIRIRRNHYE